MPQRKASSSSVQTQTIDFKTRLVLFIFWFIFIIFNSISITLYITNPDILIPHLLFTVGSAVAFTISIILFIYLTYRFGIKKVLFA
jgi:hypothetical protein